MSYVTVPVLIKNKMVKCPCCNESFAVTRKHGDGATYVSNWKKLSFQCTKILSVWISNTKMIDQKYEKKQLRQMLQVAGLYINENPFNARISELVGLRLVISTKQVKDSPHHTTQAPKYFLDRSRVLQVLNKGGSLVA